MQNLVQNSNQISVASSMYGGEQFKSKSYVQRTDYPEQVLEKVDSAESPVKYGKGKVALKIRNKIETESINKAKHSISSSNGGKIYMMES